jgi:hypothetical protein
MRYLAVSELPRQSSLQRLHVGDPRLGLDGDLPARPYDDGIPGAKVPWDRQRHFRAPRQSGVKLLPQPLEQADMGDVPNRIGGWVQPDGELKSDSDREPGELLDRRVREPTELDSADLAMGHPDCRAYLTLAQTRSHSGLPEVSADGCPDLRGDRVGPIDPAFPRSHQATSSRAAIHWELSGPFLHPERANERTEVDESVHTLALARWACETANEGLHQACQPSVGTRGVHCPPGVPRSSA